MRCPFYCCLQDKNHRKREIAWSVLPYCLDELRYFFHFLGCCYICNNHYISCLASHISNLMSFDWKGLKKSHFTIVASIVNKKTFEFSRQKSTFQKNCHVLHDRIIVLFYPLDVTSSIFIKQLRNRFGDYPKLYIVMSGGDI